MDKLIENTAQVVTNKIAIQASIQERVLGGPSNLVRAANLGLQNSDILGLIQAHLVLDYCLTENKTSEEIKAYKDGVSNFILFLAACATEQAHKNKSQEQGPTA